MRPSLLVTRLFRLASTRSMRSAKGRAAVAASCARRNLAAATICIAFVIFRVAFTEAMRLRMSFNEAIECPSACRPDQLPRTRQSPARRRGRNAQSAARPRFMRQAKAFETCSTTAFNLPAVASERSLVSRMSFRIAVFCPRRLASRASSNGFTLESGIGSR